MCLATHSLLQSAGLASLLGIGFCLAGAFLILPPLLRRYFILQTTGSPASWEGWNTKPETPVTSRILARYRTAEAYPRMFARFKLKLDPIVITSYSIHYTKLYDRFKQLIRPDTPISVLIKPAKKTPNRFEYQLTADRKIVCTGFIDIRIDQAVRPPES